MTKITQESFESTIAIVVTGLSIFILFSTLFLYFSFKQYNSDIQVNCSIQKEVWIIEKPIDLKTNTVIGATAYKINNNDILYEMFNEGYKWNPKHTSDQK